MQVNKLDPVLGQMHLYETFSLFKLKLILNGKCGGTNSGPILALQCLFETWIMVPPQFIPILCQM